MHRAWEFAECPLNSCRHLTFNLPKLSCLVCCSLLLVFSDSGMMIYTALHIQAISQWCQFFLWFFSIYPFFSSLATPPLYSKSTWWQDKSSLLPWKLKNVFDKRYTHWTLPVQSLDLGIWAAGLWAAGLWTLASGQLDAPIWDLEFGVRAAKKNGKFGTDCSHHRRCSSSILINVAEAGVPGLCSVLAHSGVDSLLASWSFEQLHLVSGLHTYLVLTCFFSVNSVSYPVALL